MKHLLLTLCAIVCFALSAHAQNYEDVVYLKNGSIIRGIIVEQVPNESIKIETRDGNLFFYRIDEIQKMTKEVPYGYRKKQSYNSRSFNKPKGYFGLIEAALPLFIGYDNGLSMGFNIINGYRVCPQFAVGGGVGVLGDFFWGDFTVPIFLHLRSDFLDRKTSPYLAFNVGYNIPVFGVYDGVFFAPSLGVSYNVGRHRMTTGLEFSANHGRYYDGYIFYRTWILDLNVKVGFSF